MINSYKAISGRYLKSNKKRTALTIIGIILSVALITSICTFILTVQNSMLEQQIKEVGAFHAVVEKATRADIEKLEINPKIDKLGLGKSEEPVQFIKDKLIGINHLNESGFELMNVQLEEGELPKKGNEIAVERWILRYFESGIKVGDEIEIKDEKGNAKSYVLSGIVKDDWRSQNIGTAKGYMAVDHEILQGSEVTALVQIKEKADKWQVINEIKESVSEGAEVSHNEDLMRLTGESSDSGLNAAITTVVIMVIGIVVLATVVVIYNAFQISIAERIKQIGLLRAIGTTKKQIINLVLREATLMILIGVPLGMFFGIIAVYCIAFVFTKLTPTGDFSNLKVVLSPITLILSGIIGALSIYASAYLPARSAGKTSPLVAISSQALIKKEKRSRGGLFLGRFLKIDWGMALKNVKRNKKRFYVTVFSMAISVTLFVTFTFFAKFSSNFTDEITESNDMDFSVSLNYNDDNVDGISEKLIDEVKAIPNVENIYKRYSRLSTCEALVDRSIIPEEVLKWSEESGKEFGMNENRLPTVSLDGKEKLSIPVVIDAYDEGKLEKSHKYVKEGSIDNLKEDEIIVVRNTRFFGERTLISPMANLKVGDEVPLSTDYYYYDGESSEVQIKEDLNYASDEVEKLKVAAIVEVAPFKDADYYETLNIIVSEKTAEKIIKDNLYLQNQYYVESLDIRLTDDVYVDGVDSALRELENTNPGITYFNKIEFNKQDKAFKIQMLILLMGFTIVISLISAVNIVNTVTTNILLRRKELAALEAIGMTNKQVRRMITFEGVLFGIYGGIIGSVLGTAFSYMLYEPMSSIRRFAFAFPWQSIIIAVTAVVIVGYISALIPLRRLKKDSIIEVIRGE
ncbi:FtsX-like permease family protein [Clostridium culturomicium]|uniref:FtsX-like permease family protein n=1 Tax=Clostridium culturomicium TaxID=1499683 RepID=UPI0006949041|nr:ABC transporter permease [Clostridium culturomicium]